jgi:hypothetical protein
MLKNIEPGIANVCKLEYKIIIEKKLNSLFNLQYICQKESNHYYISMMFTIFI